MGLPVKFYLVNDDVCIRLMLYGQDVKELLLKNNWRETKVMSEADVILINTCAFIKSAEDKAAAKIEKIVSGKKKEQEVAVFGCLPDINLERLKKIHQGISFSGRNIGEVVDVFNLKYFERSVGHKVVRPGSFFVRLIKLANRLFLKDDYFTYLYDKEKVFHLKIAEGCMGLCTYCAERLVRGILQSKSVSEIIEEFRMGLEQEYRIFSLNADDVGMFGQDRGENIAGLLEGMFKSGADFRLVLTEFNPAALVKYEKRLLPLLSSPKIVFITVPLESASSKILGLMKRQYSLSRVMPILEKIQAANPALKINTHIIVGFPGETEEDFGETLRLFDRFYFNKVKVFKYSDRSGTEANLMPDKISEEEKQRRKEVILRKVFFRALFRFDAKATILNKIGF